jgi:hypothetical protein
VTANQFRKLALGFPEAVEASHMDHPDFRVANKIFATLNQDATLGMAKLTAEQQAVFLRSEPKVFSPAAGAWGQRGCTMILLKAADQQSVRQALELAWQNTAPKRLLKAEEEP